MLVPSPLLSSTALASAAAAGALRRMCEHRPPPQGRFSRVDAAEHLSMPHLTAPRREPIVQALPCVQLSSREAEGAARVWHPSPRVRFCSHARFSRVSACMRERRAYRVHRLGAGSADADVRAQRSSIGRFAPGLPCPGDLPGVRVGGERGAYRFGIVTGCRKLSARPCHLAQRSAGECRRSFSHARIIQPCAIMRRIQSCPAVLSLREHTAPY
jgi:hypothetical protein